MTSLRTRKKDETVEAPATLSDLISELQALDGLEPLDRARQAPLLIDAAKGVLARVRAQAFEEARAGGLSLAEIGRQVGTSRAKVSEAIKEYGSAAAPVSDPASSKPATAPA